MASIIAIDPGPIESAYCLIENGTPTGFWKVRNDVLLAVLRRPISGQVCVCERIRGYGMPAGAELFETCEWSGQYKEAVQARGCEWHWLPRREVKLALCGTSRAKDGNVRQAIIDRFGGKDKAIGRKKTGYGPLHGASTDMWAAIAVGLVWLDMQRLRGAA